MEILTFILASALGGFLVCIPAIIGYTLKTRADKKILEELKRPLF